MTPANETLIARVREQHQRLQTLPVDDPALYVVAACLASAGPTLADECERLDDALSQHMEQRARERDLVRQRDELFATLQLQVEQQKAQLAAAEADRARMADALTSAAQLLRNEDDEALTRVLETTRDAARNERTGP